MLELAYTIAKKAHAGQTDKAGKPYIEHPVFVASLCKTETEKIVALLHDTVEDTGLTLDALATYGFSDEIITAVDCLTHKDGISYELYIEKVKLNPLALKVKRADLTHNADISRIPKPGPDDFKRTERYKQILASL